MSDRVMQTDDGGRLVPDDLESEACFAELKGAIACELAARIAIDDPSTPEGRDVLSELIADTVLDFFVIRQRTVPRYRPLGGCCR